MAPRPARAGCRPAALQRGRGWASRQGGRAGRRVRPREGEQGGEQHTAPGGVPQLDRPVIGLGAVPHRGPASQAEPRGLALHRVAPGGRRSRADRLYGSDLRWSRDRGLRGAGQSSGIARSAMRRHRRHPSAEEGNRLPGRRERHVRDRARTARSASFSRPPGRRKRPCRARRPSPVRRPPRTRWRAHTTPPRRSSPRSS